MCLNWLPDLWRLSSQNYVHVNLNSRPWCSRRVLCNWIDICAVLYMKLLHSFLLMIFQANDNVWNLIWSIRVKSTNRLQVLLSNDVYNSMLNSVIKLSFEMLPSFWGPHIYRLCSTIHYVPFCVYACACTKIMTPLLFFRFTCARVSLHNNTTKTFVSP
jgi:hypothetical protein